jgi:hypothetical protein
MSELKGVVKEARRKGFSNSEIRRLLIGKGYSKNEVDFVLGLSVKEGDGDSDGGFGEKIGLLFSSPRSFFSKVRGKGIGKSLVMLLIVGALAGVLKIGLSSVMSGFFGGRLTLGGVFGLGLIFPAAMYIFWILGSFIYAGIVHGVVKVSGGKGSVSDSYNVCAYSFVPYLALSIVPFVGWLAFIYSITLMIFGLSEYHEISKGKAAAAALTPVLILGVLFVMFLFYIFSFGF